MTHPLTQPVPPTPNIVPLPGAAAARRKRPARRKPAHLRNREALDLIESYRAKVLKHVSQALIRGNHELLKLALDERQFLFDVEARLKGGD